LGSSFSFICGVFHCTSSGKPGTGGKAGTAGETACATNTSHVFAVVGQAFPPALRGEVQDLPVKVQVLLD
jgi:hypothetical protein